MSSISTPVASTARIAAISPSPAEVEPAAHPAGVGAHQPVAGLDETELLEHRRGAGAGGLPVLPEQPGDQFEVLAPGHRRFDRRELTGETDQAANRLRLAADVV